MTWIGDVTQSSGSASTSHRGDPHRAIRRGLLPFARRHRALFWRASLFTCLLVASRLALPLPLTAIVEHSTAGAPGQSPLQDGLGAVALMAAAFVSLALVAGLAEHFQRLGFAHFAGRTVSDARAAALAGLGRGDAEPQDDLTAEVMADSGRVKQGLKGVLNHIVLNALLLVGGCVALAVADPQLGLVQLVGVAIVVAVAVLGAGRVAAVASRHRNSEAVIAGVIHDLVTAEESASEDRDLDELRDLDAHSGQADVAITRWEGRTTAVTHVVLTLTAAVILQVGLAAVDAGRIDTGTLFAVAAYLVLLHGPGVRFARQVTRIGPLLVSADHLALVVVTAGRTDPVDTLDNSAERSG